VNSVDRFYKKIASDRKKKKINKVPLYISISPSLKKYIKENNFRPSEFFEVSLVEFLEKKYNKKIELPVFEDDKDPFCFSTDLEKSLEEVETEDERNWRLYLAKEENAHLRPK